MEEQSNNSWQWKDNEHFEILPDKTQFFCVSVCGLLVLVRAFYMCVIFLLSVFFQPFGS